MAQGTPEVQAETLVLRDRLEEHTIEVGTSAWYDWLSTANRFSFASPQGNFTACKECRQHGSYWKAYRKRSGRMYRAYLGKTQHLSLDRLNEVAMALSRSIRDGQQDTNEGGSARPSVPESAATHDTRDVEPPRRTHRGAQHDPLLMTKLAPPIARPELVPRPRLFERLSQGLRRTLTLVSAPPGFGKTTLLSQWSLVCGRPVAWVSLDGGDNDPARFWTYVVAALQTLYPHLGDAALAMLQAPHAPAIESSLAALINAILAAPDELALVLDDYHVIENQAVHDGVSFLLRHLPPRLHLVITTRTDPPLPLARLRARDQMTELRAAELSFLPAETASFLNEIMRLGLSAEDVATLEERTEGWIGGLQMAALSMQGSNDIPGFVKAFAGEHRYVADYLLEEVLRRQPEGVRAFLLQTSILDRLTGPLCEAVSGLSEGEGQATLEALEKANLFTEPLDNERHWYRYHHLFAGCLGAILNRSQPGRVRELHGKASAWYASQGLINEAVHHALAAGEPELAADLIERAAEALVRRSEVVTVLSWLRALPDDLVRARPRLCIADASALWLSGQLDAAEARLRDAERGLAGCGHRATAHKPPRGEPVASPIIEHDMLVIRAGNAGARSDLSLEIELCRQALETPFQEGGIWTGRLVPTLNLGYAYAWSGDPARASGALAEAAMISREARHVFGSTMALSQLASVQVVQGLLHQAARTYEQALALAEEHGTHVFRIACRPRLGLALVQYEWNDMKGASESAIEGIELADKGAIREVLLFGHGVLARLKHAQGDIDGALDSMREAERLARVSNLTRELQRIAAYRARLWLAQGNLEAAIRWAQTSDLRVDGELTYLREAEHVTLARVLVAEGEPGRAALLLQQLLHSAEASGRYGDAIKILAPYALALHALGECDRSLDTLHRAISLAEPEGWVRTFVDLGPAMKELLSRLLEAGQRDRTITRRGASSHYLHTLLAVFDQVDPEPASGVEALGNGEPFTALLSKREIEVLRLIAAGWSPTQIAQELVVSKNTVKSHCKSIYSKLEARNRAEVLARARGLQLL